MRRTGLLGILLAATLLAGSTGAASGGTSAPAGPPPADPFTHGVAVRASSRSAQFWVRTLTEGIYTLKVSREPDLDPATEHAVETDAAHDNTATPVVGSLTANRRYYYAFFDGLTRSQLGTFKTMPRKDRFHDLDMAVTGDSDVLWTDHPEPQDRPFSVLDRVREENPDFFIYMGDTIYSDSETGAPFAATLEEKWDKYKNNRALPAVQQVLRKVSTWAVWDDHEVINDFDGADLKETDPILFQDGRQAFTDYWPVNKKRFYRKVNWGPEIDLIYLDERSYRHGSADGENSPCRDEEGDLDLAPQMPEEQRESLGLDPVDPDCLTHIRKRSHTILGDEQRAWFKDRLRSNARWKLVINEVPLAQLFVRPYDRWEGFEWERNNILEFIKKKGLKGVVFLTTDLHANIQTRVYKDITKEDSKPITYEMISGPIQTCTLDCEVDNLGGATGEILQSFLISEGLTDTDCINIKEYGYGMASLGDKARSLKLALKSHEADPDADGGTPMTGYRCDGPVKLTPSTLGGDG